MKGLRGWELNTLIDESDPDTELSQIQHLLQTAEAIRKDGKPEWMQVTGLIHDLGKLILFYEDSKFDASKDKDNFRDYEAACDRVKNFYAEQHAKQTLAYNLEAREQFRANVRARMGVWEAIEKLYRCCF